MTRVSELVSENLNKAIAKYGEAVYATNYGADPTFFFDSTGAIQTAVNIAKANGLSRVHIPAGLYRVDGTVNVDTGILITGENAPEASQVGRSMGTVLVAGKNSSGPVFSFVPDPALYGATGMMKGGGFAGGLHILGSDHWNTFANAVNRPAVYMERVQTEFTIDDLYITGFLKQGLRMVRVYDGSIRGGRIMYCSTDGVYAALSQEGDASGANNTNAVHIFGLHMENNPFMLYANKLSRHVQFIGGKFELHAGQTLSNPFVFDDVREYTFDSSTIVTRCATDLTAYSNPDLQPHTFFMKGGGCVKFIGNDFTSSPTGDGARIIKQDASSPGRLMIQGNYFNNLYAGGGEYPIILKDSALFTGNNVVTRSLNNKRQIIDVIGTKNRITDNIFDVVSGGTTPDGSAGMFRVSAEGNLFDNTINGATPSKILVGDQKYIERTNVRVVENVLEQFEINNSTPSVGYNNPSGSSDYKVSNTVATSITNMLDGRDGQVVRLMSINGTATTFVHDPTKIIMQAGANKTIQGYGKFITFIRRGGAWFEI